MKTDNLKEVKRINKYQWEKITFIFHSSLIQQNIWVVFYVNRAKVSRECTVPAYRELTILFIHLILHKNTAPTIYQAHF